MSMLRRFWDWVLPGMISLGQMGAFAYYVAGEAAEFSPNELPRAA